MADSRVDPAIPTLGDFIESRETAFRRTDDFAGFFTTLGVDEMRRVGALWGAVALHVGGARSLAATRTEALVRAMPDEEDGAGAFIVRTFAEALLSRLRGAGGAGGNLYLHARPPGAQLRAFELLRLRTPLIPFAYAAGNRALLSAVTTPQDVTLVDVGIGRAGQIVALLRNPAARRLFKSLRVIGLEPDSSSRTGSGALEVAERNVLTVGQEVGIPVSFAGIGKLAEELTARDLESAGLRGFVLGNAAFALHHVTAQVAGDDVRDRVLRILREAGVRTMVLVEPDSNHFEDDLAVRFLYAYRHYRSISHGLVAMLAPADAALVWNEFFAPEVHNVITHDGAARTERHEETRRWQERLANTGWTVEPLRDLVPQSAAPHGFMVRRDGAAFCLGYRGVSVLGVMRARA